MDIVNLENEAVLLLERLLEIPRTSRDEGKAADLLQDFMAGRYGLEVHRHGCNLWTLAPNYDPSRKTLLLNAHIDTVKPVAGWTFDPFSAGHKCIVEEIRALGEENFFHKDYEATLVDTYGADYEVELVVEGGEVAGEAASEAAASSAAAQ